MDLKKFAAQAQMESSNAKDRPFTRLAASVALGPEAVKALDKGNCPMCKGPIGPFRDDVSKREYHITGLCQQCQDEVFAPPEG